MQRRKSKNEKLLTGSFRADQHKESPNYAPLDPRPPAHVKRNKLALAAWRHLVDHLGQQGVLQESDRYLLETYALTYARWREAVDHINTNGLILTTISQTRTGKTEKPIASPAILAEIRYSNALTRIGTKLGASPLDRERITVSPFDDNDDDKEGVVLTFD